MGRVEEVTLVKAAVTTSRLCRHRRHSHYHHGLRVPSAWRHGRSDPLQAGAAGPGHRRVGGSRLHGPPLSSLLPRDRGIPPDQLSRWRQASEPAAAAERRRRAHPTWTLACCDSGGSAPSRRAADRLTASAKDAAECRDIELPRPELSRHPTAESCPLPSL